MDCGCHVGTNRWIITNHKRVCMPRVLPPPLPLPEPLPPTAPLMDDDDQGHDDDAAIIDAGGEDFGDEDVVNACLARCSDDVTLSHSQEYLDWQTPSISDSEAQVQCHFHFCPFLCPPNTCDGKAQEDRKEYQEKIHGQAPLLSCPRVFSWYSFLSSRDVRISSRVLQP